MTIPEIKFTKIFINNEWCDSEDRATFPTINPANEKVIAQVQEGREKDINKAVKVAKEAFKFGSEWRTMDASKRGLLLHKFADLIDANVDYISQVESLDNGKPFSIAKIDVSYSATVVRYFAGYADKITGVTSPADGNFITYTRIEPVGVVAALLPWNYPFLLTIYKVAKAVAAGCTLIIKPAEQTSLTALIIGDLVLKAGFPKGVVNIVPGFGPTAGAALARHPDVDKIAFNGSTAVGKIIMKHMGETSLKRINLEMEGRTPVIIFADAHNLDDAAQLAHEASLANNGQCCVAGSRTFVEASIYDTMVNKLKVLAEKRTVGDPFDENTLQGPQIDKDHFDKIFDLIESAKKEGATLVTGGKRIGNIGFFVQPTVFSDVKDTMRIAKEEILGPLQSIYKFHTMEEVIERANNTDHGLGASVVTSDINKALMMTQALQAGTVWINCFDVCLVNSPFGGFKQSGIGRELALYGLQPYTEVKSVTIAIPQKNS